MLALPIALFTLLPAQQAQPNPGQIVSKMFAYYSGARAMSGTISMTQTLLGQSTNYTTELQFELPSKLFIRQTHKQSGKVYLVTSDGKGFSYDFPSNLQKLGSDQRLFEAVQQGNRKLVVKDIYHAASQSIRDRSPALDIAIGDNEDLAFLRDQWATVEYKNKQALGDEQVHVINGKWREYKTAIASATYAMGITEDFQLRRFVLRENLVVPGKGAQEVVTAWDVRLVKGGTLDQALFKVVH